jgi:hypothetical protein
VAAEAGMQPQAPLQPAAPQQQQHFAERAPAGAGTIFLAAGALAAEPPPRPSPSPFGALLRRKSSPLSNAGTQEWARPLPKKPSLRRRCRVHLDEQRGLCRR